MSRQLLVFAILSEKSTEREDCTLVFVSFRRGWCELAVKRNFVLSVYLDHGSPSIIFARNTSAGV